MIWILFTALILTLLFIDLVVLHKKGEELNHRKAAIETMAWVTVALLFSGVIYYVYHNDLNPGSQRFTGMQAVTKYITGYLIELSLSVDNLFVIAVIFASFKIPINFQHRVLFWGILGAIFFRGALIGAGILLIEKISWMSYVFGLFLLFTAFKMLAHDDDDQQQEEKVSSRMRKYFKVGTKFDGEKFFTREQGRRVATPLFAALVMIELTDVMFALDSIPAIIAVTTDPFLVYSSNLFAILGLRAMYFFLSHMLRKFRYLKYSVFAILIFVALKLIVIHYVEFPEWFSLTFIAVSLGMGILISMHHRPGEEAESL